MVVVFGYYVGRYFLKGVLLFVVWLCWVAFVFVFGRVVFGVL